MSAFSSENKSMSPKIRAVLEETVGNDMANRIIVGSCNILSIEERELYGENYDHFVGRMEIVIPAIVGYKPGQVIIERLWRLGDDIGA